MEIISKVSKGSKMDQIYISKNREGIGVGTYVIIKPIVLTEKQGIEKPYFYNVEGLEPIKLQIIEKIFKIADRFLLEADNIIITGSFLEKGFNFSDIDILIVLNEKIKIGNIAREIEKEFSIKAHIILLSYKELISGLETDPLYQLMLSKCVARKRFIYEDKRKINYKLLDLHLIKSKGLIENFDFLDGNQKYGLIRNAIAIYLFLQGKKISYGVINREIEKVFNVKDISVIKKNMLNKKDFLNRYGDFYNMVFSMIIKNTTNNKNDTK